MTHAIQIGPETHFEAAQDVVRVDATKTLYVADLHDHGDHKCCGCEGACDCDADHFDFAVADQPRAASKTPQSMTEIAMTQGYAYDFGLAALPTYDILTPVVMGVDTPTVAITASAVASDGAMQTGYTSGGDAASSFNIMITYGGDLAGELAEAFSKAADYFSAIILADVADLSTGLDDIVIDASLIEIDGAGSVLGRAGPQFVRSSNYLPTEAIMEFDVADAANFYGQGLWDDIVFHEMLHTLGFGTLWGYMDLRDGSIAGGDMRFNGTHANDVYEDEFADLAASDGFVFGVPIETGGGSGTAGGHWDEATFNNEIMTGYVNGSNFMSWMSIAALEDMGYDTIYDNPYDSSDAFGTAPVGDPLDIV